MATRRIPTVRQQRLGLELRRLREQRDLSAEDVAHRLKWSQSKVSRIETAKVGIHIEDVTKLTKLYEVTEKHTAELVALTQSAMQKGWWEDYHEISDDVASFFALEDSASACFSYETHTITGLLQTEEYARHVIGGWNLLTTLSPRSLARRVEIRLRRQQLLNSDPPLHLALVMDEAILLRSIGGPAVMQRQLTHLAELSKRPNIAIHIQPLEISRNLVMEPFALLEFSDDTTATGDFPPVVCIDSMAPAILRDDEIVHICRLAWQELQKSALPVDESAELIGRIASERWAS